MVAKYSVLAWGARGVQTGALIDRELELRGVAGDLPVDDIRNCSSAAERSWGALTGVNRQTQRQELWRFDLEGTRAESLLALDYILHNAIDPTGRHICYAAPPSRTRGDITLYDYDLQTSRSDLIVEAGMSRYCIPSWRASIGRIVYHTVEGQVVEVDSSTKQVTPLFKGEYPAVSPDGIVIAYCDGNDIRFWNSQDQRSTDRSVDHRFLEGQLQGGMSWSPDGKFLLVGYSAGVVRHELAFYRIEVETGSRVEIPQRYLKGLRFI
jgi:WD40 repeat protein